MQKSYLQIMSFFRKSLSEINKKDFMIYLFATCILYGSVAFHANINIDSEVAIYRVQHDAWIGDGRWVNFLIEKFLFPQSYVPLLSVVLFSISLSFCYSIIISVLYPSLGFVKKTLIYLTFCLNPVWAHIIAFPSNINPIAIGISFASIQILLFKGTELNGNKYKFCWLQLVVSSLAYMTIFGIYQSLVFVSLVVVLIFLIYEYCYENKNIINQLITLTLSLAIGFAIYLLIQKKLLLIYPHSTEYIMGYLPSDLLSKDWWNRLPSTMGNIIKTISGARAIWNTGNQFLLITITSAFIIIFYSLKSKLSLKKLLFFVVLLLMFFTPFSFNFLRMMPMPLRTYTSFPVIYISLLILAIKINRKKLFDFSLVILIFILSIQLLYTLALYQNSMLNARERDKFIAFDLYNKIVNATQDFHPNNNICVDIRGKIENDSPFPKSETIGASIFEWDNGACWRMCIYIKTLCYKNLVPVDEVS